MSPIQIILILSLAAVILYVLFKLKEKPAFKIILIVIAVTGIVFVIKPEFTTQLAHQLNVGRGTDLLFYLFGVGGFVALLILYSSIRQSEQRLTAIARKIAIRNARRGS